MRREAVANDGIEFREACGLAGPLRLTVAAEGKEDPVPRELDQPFAMIGRRPGNDLILPHEAVSRYHAYLQVIGGRLFCLDLESRTGTRGENSNASPEQPGFDQTIRIGPFRIHVSGDLQSSGTWLGSENLKDPLQVEPAADAFLRAVELDFLDVDQKRSSWRMTRLLALVGQSARCKVQLVHPSVAKFHCSLLRTPRGVWVVRLRRNISVNGVSVYFTRLNHGDVLQVGKFSISIRYLQGSNAPHSHLPVPRRSPSPIEGLPVPLLNTLLVPANPASELVANSDRSVFEPVLVQILNQFSAAQQQMFAQQQQTMMVLLQMLDLMHRDTKGAIREELDCLQRITQELRSVQAQLSSSAPAPLPQPPRKPAPAPKPANRVAGKAPAEPTKPPPPQAPAAEPNQGVAHSWLVERMATLGTEQQTSWQKLVTYLRAKLGGAE
jgi:hypothetical protein